MVSVKFYANLRHLAGGNELSVHAGSVRSVLNDLMAQAPALTGALLANGELGQHVVVILNGRNVTDLDIAVDENDALAIFPPIAGG